MKYGNYHIETPWDRYEEASEEARSYYLINEKSAKAYLNGEIDDDKRDLVRKEYARLLKDVDDAEAML
jgi:hypothetical protein